MYWENYVEQRRLFSREEEPTAKKEHECCECERKIKIGEKYSYFVGGWYEGYYGNFFHAYKTCLECEKDWDEILEVFSKNGEYEACCVFGLLSEAIQDAFDEGFLEEDDRLVKEWLGIEPEVPEADVENLSPEERDDHERREAAAQMMVHSAPLL